ncbi:hypothetical protein AGLY_001080, partial [Aphis glycines]
MLSGLCNEALYNGFAICLSLTEKRVLLMKMMVDEVMIQYLLQHDHRFTRGVNSVKYRNVVTSTIQSPSLIVSNKNVQPIEPIPFKFAKTRANTTTLISVAKKKHLTIIQSVILMESAAKLLKSSVIEIRHLRLLAARSFNLARLNLVTKYIMNIRTSLHTCSSSTEVLLFIIFDCNLFQLINYCFKFEFTHIAYQCRILAYCSAFTSYRSHLSHSSFTFHNIEFLYYVYFTREKILSLSDKHIIKQLDSTADGWVQFGPVIRSLVVDRTSCLIRKLVYFKCLTTTRSKYEK